jgi:hypothetical protein
VYARSSADDKAPVVALLAALDAIRAAGLKARSNVKFVFEGEEEIGSPNLEKMLSANKDLFSGDVWLFCDGPVYQTRQQSVVFGARGIAAFDLTVYGPRAELHSGHYGNWAPNPALSLARLLASMKDPLSDRVTIPGFYDQVEPLTDREKKAIADAPAIDAALMRELWLGSTEGRPRTLNELITPPSLNIRGMASARWRDRHQHHSGVGDSDVRRQAGEEDERPAHIRCHPRYIRSRVPRRDSRAGCRGAAKPSARGAARAARAEAARVDGSACLRQEVVRIVQSVRGPRWRCRRWEGSCCSTPSSARSARHDRDSHRQPRQQPAQRQREPADSEPVGRHRADGGAADDGGAED